MRRSTLTREQREARAEVRLRIEAATELLRGAVDLAWEAKLPDWRRTMLIQVIEALTTWARRLRQTGRPPMDGGPPPSRS